MKDSLEIRVWEYQSSDWVLIAAFEKWRDASIFVSIKMYEMPRGDFKITSGQQQYGYSEHPHSITIDIEEYNRMKEKIKRMTKALEKFAKLEENYRSSNGGDAVFANGCIYVADLRNAREAVK